MTFPLKKFYVKTVRKVLVIPSIRKLITRFFPRFFAISESIYIAYKDIESNYLGLFSNKEKVTLDIGVLWGGYTFKLKNLSKEVISFEPNFENYLFLKKAFKFDKNVIIKHSAVSSSTGETIFRIPSGHPGNATIEKQNSLGNFKEINELVVPTIAIDDLKLENLGFIKIDIEGHELAALKGMRETLKTQKPNLLVEIENRHYQAAVEKVGRFMEALGYKMFFLRDKILLDISHFNIAIDQAPEKRNTGYYINNFIFIHGDSKNTFIKSAKKKGLTIEI